MDSLITEAKFHRSLNNIELVRRRNEAGLSQQQLADMLAAKLERVSLSRTYIVQLENIDNPDIPIGTAQALAEIFEK